MDEIYTYKERGGGMKKRIAVLATATLIGAIMGATAFAANTDKSSLSGGWYESRGYYIDGVEGSTDTYVSGTSVVKGMKLTSTYANNEPSPTPDKHTGKRLTQIIDSAGTAKYAAFGETLWYYKYHYTTAQMELSNGTVKTTSGRQWGDNATKATSPYYLPGLFENIEARTYWGS